MAEVFALMLSNKVATAGLMFMAGLCTAMALSPLSAMGIIQVTIKHDHPS